MSWNALAHMGLTVKPFAGQKPKPGNRRSQFSASTTQTLRTLSREMSHLSAKRIVIELDVQERDIRLAGYPRANARVDHPAVAVSFESRFGPLRYATCEFTSWEDNLRAIALAMEALRAVDRYGVSKRGEQYQGWRAIPQTTSGDPGANINTIDDARRVLDEWDGDLKAALFATHPDRGGDPDDFRRVMRAKELLA
jgi:hypothetical protein